ncbi:hypothetical protein BS78_01G198100 [Paspalum vaginatum]|nr:hypothetical protein BS78_01G198100 [Paspalum vaginatum]
MATPSSPPSAPASVLRLPPLHRPSLPLLRFWPAPAGAAAAASPISLVPGCRPFPRIRCRAAAGPSPPSSEPPPPSPHGWQESLSRLQDRARIFFAVLFWMSLFFWGSAWADGSNNSGGKKRQRFRKKPK